MSRRALIPVLAVSLVSLSACLTPHVQPTPSQAVAQARARAGAKPQACAAAGGLEAISPVDMGFAFDDATVTEVGHKHLTEAVRWLACNPTAEVVIKPDADAHGDTAHLNDLAGRRAQATMDDLRALGAKDPVIHMLARAAADPVTAPHLVIKAQGRSW